MPTLHERVLALEKNAVRADQRMERAEKQMLVIRDLIREGMRIVVQNAKEQRELRASIRELQASVRELTNSRKRGPNGRVKSKLDIP